MGWTAMRETWSPEGSRKRCRAPVGNAKWNMHRGNGSGGGLQMFELVIEKDMGFQDVEHPLFLNPTKKECFIYLDVPGV